MTVVPNFLGRATTNMMKKDLLSTTGRGERPENLTATPLLDRAHVGWGETLVDVGWVIASEWKFSSGGWQSSFSGIIPLQLWKTSFPGEFVSKWLDQQNFHYAKAKSETMAQFQWRFRHSWSNNTSRTHTTCVWTIRFVRFVIPQVPRS